jgi:hypothetical protein
MHPINIYRFLTRILASMAFYSQNISFLCAGDSRIVKKTNKGDFYARSIEIREAIAPPKSGRQLGIFRTLSLSIFYNTPILFDKVI